MKTELCSWRVSPEVKADLEREARARKVPVSSVLDAAVQQWLDRNNGNLGDEEWQRKLHAAAEKCFGVLSGGAPRRSQTVRESVRERLRRRYGR